MTSTRTGRSPSPTLTWLPSRDLLPTPTSTVSSARRTGRASLRCKTALRRTTQ
ncbi:hypothetical protein NP493_1741g00016 [Ridgeia piscesae]|uniref:Uncharacterized protein n=1 Tax=Ridgeia piscesae TaxID=27915 RepID=A0AAD9N9H2_RIDPI|nr:hypothetical protein NP493_1741g00016 [Ridgeia piscesae]